MTRLIGTVTLALIAAATMAAPSMAAYTDGQAACYAGYTDARGSVVAFDGSLPGCVDGIGVRLGVPNVDGILVSGPWLYWAEP
jgi:hypothetical protein